MRRFVASWKTDEALTICARSILPFPLPDHSYCFRRIAIAEVVERPRGDPTRPADPCVGMGRCGRARDGDDAWIERRRGGDGECDDRFAWALEFVSCAKTR